MDVGTCSDNHNKANSDTQHRRPKREHKGVDDALSARKQNSTGINDLPDCVLNYILSCLRPKEAARTCVLSGRWRYLRFLLSETLEFDNTDMFSSDDRAMFSSGAPRFHRKDIDTRIEFLGEKFIAWVNRVLKLHQDVDLDGLIIRFSHLCSQLRFGRGPGYMDSWIYFAMHKELKMLELNFSKYGGYPSDYEYTNVDLLLSHSHDVNKFGFGSLRSLRLVGVDIKNVVVEYFLASCRYLELLCIRGSYVTRNLGVVDPLPNLKVLEISDCHRIHSLQVSAVNLVLCTYEGNEIYLPFKEVPNLSELTLGGHFARSFIYEPNKHANYSVQLVKLALSIPDAGYSGSDSYRGIYRADLPPLYKLEHLELNVRLPVGGNIHFFTSLIKASPSLIEFKIKISYTAPSSAKTRIGFPDVFPYPESYQWCHKNLKAVKMSGYVGCLNDGMFLFRLLTIAPSLETITIDTESEYYEQRDSCIHNPAPKNRFDPAARNREGAKGRARHLNVFSSADKGNINCNVMCIFLMVLPFCPCFRNGPMYYDFYRLLNVLFRKYWLMIYKLIYV